MDDTQKAYCRILISYAHESPEHTATVKKFADLLISAGIDAQLDQFDDGQRQDWVSWTLNQMRRAERVLVIASPTYRRRFEKEAPVDEGRGVQLEALLIREEIYRNQRAALRKFVPVVLPGADQDDIPTLLLPYSGTHYRLREISTEEADGLIRLLKGGSPSQVPTDQAVQYNVAPEEPIVALHLVVIGGTALAGDDVVRCLVEAGCGDAAIEFDAETRSIGAVLLGSPATFACAFAHATRSISSRVDIVNRRAGSPPLRVRIGAHRAKRPEDAALGADKLARCPAACRMHGAPGADVVVAMSDELFRDLMDSSDPYPRRHSFRNWPSDGESGELCWLAVPGRPATTLLPTLIAEETAYAPTPEPTAPRFTVGVNNGTVSYTERDAVLNIVNHFGRLS